MPESSEAMWSHFSRSKTCIVRLQDVQCLVIGLLGFLLHCEPSMWPQKRFRSLDTLSFPCPWRIALNRVNATWSSLSFFFKALQLSTASPFTGTKPDGVFFSFIVCFLPCIMSHQTLELGSTTPGYELLLLKGPPQHTKRNRKFLKASLEVHKKHNCSSVMPSDSLQNCKNAV